MRNLGEVLRDEMVVQHKIIELLHEGPKSVSEIAEALKRPTREVTLWVMAMWRYGKLVETGKPDDDGYYKYQLKQ